MAFTAIGPLQLGHAATFFEGGFSVDAALRVITSQRITSLAAAPTVYRLMMAGRDAAMAPIAGHLRVASSAGEPLNPEVVRWADRVLRVPLHDHYGQTETLMTVNNHHGLGHSVKPGAAGLPMPGYSLAVLTMICVRFRRTRRAYVLFIVQPHRCLCSTAIGLLIRRAFVEIGI
jgi:acetyl-CoA synthetase